MLGAPDSFPVLLLVGGESRRMGMPKGLVPDAGRPWLESQLVRVKDAGAAAAAVVLGHAYGRYLEAIPLLAATFDEWGSAGGLRLVTLLNPAPERGQFSSLQTGLRRLDEDGAPGVFVLPIDTPCPGPDVFERLAGAMTGAFRAAKPVHELHGGHPVLLSGELIGHLLTLDPAEARLDQELFKLTSRELVRVPVSDPRVRLNFNTPEEFAV